jgi:hypothetical protein
LPESNPESTITSLIPSQAAQAAIFFAYFIMAPCQIEDGKIRNRNYVLNQRYVTNGGKTTMQGQCQTVQSHAISRLFVILSVMMSPSVYITSHLKNLIECFGLGFRV